MSVLGIGPILAIVGGATTALVILVQALWGVQIGLDPPWAQITQVLGILLGVMGILFWGIGAVAVERAFKSHRLVTTGVFRFCRNPLYSAFILFIVPAVAFFANNLLFLLASATMFVAFKLQIRKEEDYLAKEFGPEYERYMIEVGQLVPFLHVHRHVTEA
jgi:protein-S-isoprenylcysteine O-methyltransferase Ste14